MRAIVRAITDLLDPATPKKGHTSGLSDLYGLSSLLKSGICEGHVVMDVRAHTVVWDCIHRAEHGDVHMQRDTFHECAFQLPEFALVLCEPRADVRDCMSRSWNRYT